jgi:hypothetical protein
MRAIIPVRSTFDFSNVNRAAAFEMAHRAMDSQVTATRASAGVAVESLPDAHNP